MCNLACAHCYSQSSPAARDAVPVEILTALIDDAAELGYRAVAFSGGEPLMYPGLAELLRRARARGLSTSVTTNGTVLDQSRVARLRELVGLLAVSLDGPATLHNEIRGSKTAFARLETGVTRLRASGIRFGFLHTLTRQSWEHLPWLAEFASDHGADLLQIHPLEMFGRAVEIIPGHVLDEEAEMRAYLLCTVLAAKYRQRMAIQLDLVHQSQALANPVRFYATEDFDEARQPADLLSTVVLEPDGVLVPIAYGFSRRLTICNVWTHRFAAAWGEFVRTGYPSLLRLCRAAFAAMTAPGAAQLSNWHDVIVRESLGWDDLRDSCSTAMS
jgi:pyruvate-formate lyase-activating enzyme